MSVATGGVLVTSAASEPEKRAAAWIADALGQNNNSTLDKLAARDCITTQSFQVTADVAAIGPQGRGSDYLAAFFTSALLCFAAASMVLAIRTPSRPTLAVAPAT